MTPITPEVIDDVIADIELEQQGAQLYYAVDPHDVNKFCFPIDPDAETLTPVEKIAEHQAAMYEVCYERSLPPILLAEYGEELDSVIDHHLHHALKAFTKLGQLQEFVRSVKREKGDLYRELINRARATKKDTRDFHIVLAVVMGVYNLGTERLEAVVNRMRDPIQGPVRELIWRIKEEFSPSDLTKRMFDQIVKSLPNRRRSASADARAIDRVLFMNTALEQAFLDHDLTERHIFLYLSSAERNFEVFRMPEVQERLPIINGSRFPIHRKPGHLFAYLLTKGKGPDRQTQLAECLKNLWKMRELLAWKRTHRLSRQLSFSAKKECPCILEGADATACESCRYLQNCRAVEKLEQVQAQQGTVMRNLRLVSTIESYSNFLSLSATDRDAQFFLAHFKDIFESIAKKDWALEEISRVTTLMRIQENFRGFVENTIVSSEERPQNRWHMYLFHSFFEHSEGYREVLVALESMEQIHYQEDANRLRAYHEAIRLFSSSESASSFDEHRELVRCILYLTCPTNEGDRLAFGLASDLYESSQFRADFLTVLVWTAPRMRKFDEAQKYAAIGARDFPSDPRFPHGRALGIVKQLNTESPDNRDALILEMIDCQEIAVQLAEGVALSDPTAIMLRALAHNNLAYFYVFAEWRDEYDSTWVGRARESISKLEIYIPRSEWQHNNVHFFHTVARVELYEALVLERDAKDSLPPSEQAEKLTLAREKYKSALVNISDALQLMEKVIYKALKEDIEGGLSRVNQKHLQSARSDPPGATYVEAQ